MKSEAPIRVLHVIGGGDTGGAMTHLLPLAAALPRFACEVRLLCLGGGRLSEEADSRGLEVTTIPMANAWDVRALGPLGQHVRDGGFQIVHSHGMRANLPARLATASLRPRPRLFTTVHSDLLLDYESRPQAVAYLALDRATVVLADRVICVSTALRQRLIRRGYPPHRLTTIHSGLDLSTDSPLRSSPPDARRGASPSFGTVARLVPVKDVDLFLEVALRVRRVLPESRAVVVGDGPERARLERRADELGLHEAVSFVGQMTDPGGLVRSLDVYMVTSVYEGGVSMAVLEAMAAGIPVVTTDGGGVTEAVNEGVTGFVVPRGTDRVRLADGLAERVSRLLTDPGLRAEMGKAAVGRVRARFTIDQAALLTAREYRRCLAAHP